MHWFYKCYLVGFKPRGTIDPVSCSSYNISSCVQPKLSRAWGMSVLLMVSIGLIKGTAHILYPVKLAFLFYFSVLRLWKILIWILIAKTPCGNAFIPLPSLGFLYDHSMWIPIVSGYKNLNCHRWSYGANRVQVDADIKVLSEFLSYLQSDSVRGPVAISSLSTPRLTSKCRCYEFYFHNTFRFWSLSFKTMLKGCVAWIFP